MIVCPSSSFFFFFFFFFSFNGKSNAFLPLHLPSVLHTSFNDLPTLRHLRVRNQHSCVWRLLDSNFTVMKRSVQHSIWRSKRHLNQLAALALYHQRPRLSLAVSDRLDAVILNAYVIYSMSRRFISTYYTEPSSRELAAREGQMPHQ